MTSMPPAVPGLPELTHRYVAVRGARFHLAQLPADPDRGQDDGLGLEAGADSDDAPPPILFLHGLPTHWYLWRRVLAELAGSRRLICLDLRGCGWSEPTRAGYATRDQVQDILAVLDTLGVDRVDLVGHESGGWLGFLLCFAAPERVRSYLAVNTSHPWIRKKGGVMWSAWRFWYTAFWEYPGIGRRVLRHWPGFTRARLKSWAGDGGRALDEIAREEYVRSYREKGRSRALEQNLWQFVLHDIPALAKGTFNRRRLTVPTLLLAGDSDTVTVLESAAQLPEHAGDLEVRVVPGGRLLPETAPALVAAAARERFSIRAQSHQKNHL